MPKGVAEVITDEGNSLICSAANIWEVAIKAGLGRLSFSLDPHVFRKNVIASGYRELPVTADHALAAATLPHHHKDPFDRILVGQSLAEGITLLTADPVMARYPGPIRLFRR